MVWASSPIISHFCMILVFLTLWTGKNASVVTVARFFFLMTFADDFNDFHSLKTRAAANV